MGGCEDKTSAHETEVTPLEASAREWLAKTQHAGKGLASAVIICEL
jgi:hypothetical protein